MKFRLLGIFFLFCMCHADLAMASSKDRGGGTFLACESPNGQIYHLGFIDFLADENRDSAYERYNFGRRVDTEGMTDYKEILDQVLNEISSNDSALGKTLKAKAYRLIQNVEFHDDLPLTDDFSNLDYHFRLKCQSSKTDPPSKTDPLQKAVPIQGAIQIFSSAKLLISKKIWNHPEMDAYHKAALIFHEAYYSFLKENSPHDGDDYRSPRAQSTYRFVREHFIEKPPHGHRQEHLTKIYRRNMSLLRQNIFVGTTDVRMCGIDIVSRKTGARLIRRFNENFVSVTEASKVPLPGSGPDWQQLSNSYVIKGKFELKGLPIEFDFQVQLNRSFDRKDGQKVYSHEGFMNQCTQVNVNGKNLKQSCSQAEKFYIDTHFGSGVSGLALPTKENVIRETFSYDPFQIEIYCHSLTNSTVGTAHGR